MVDHFNALRLAELASSGLRRRDTLAMLAGAGSAAVFGLPAFGQEAPRKGGVLKIASAANPSSLDPMTGGSGLDHSFLWTIYDTLVEWDYESLKPKPGIAKWSFPDPKTMVLDISRTFYSTMVRHAMRRRSSSISTACVRISVRT